MRDGANVSRETSERLDEYVSALEKWNRRINLIGAATTEDIWQRHIADALQLLPLAPEQTRWVDLGSGGGLPGIVLAIQLVNAEDSWVTLVESDQRKAVFLRQIIQKLELKASVLAERAEALDPLSTEIITARALAPLPKLLGYVARHLAPDGRALLPKGRLWQSELLAAQQQWTFDHKVWQSDTDAEAAILEISNIDHI